MPSISLVHPVTGAPLLAGASLQNCYLLIADQIFTYDIPDDRTGEQHTDDLLDPYVVDAQSYAVGVSIQTLATRGQVMRIEVSGTAHGGKSLKTT